MPTKREMLEEILWKLESIVESQSEMKSSIQDLQSSQFNLRQSMNELEKQHNQLEPVLKQLPDSEVETEIEIELPTTTDSQSNFLVQALVLIDSSQKAMSSSIAELHSEINHIKSSLLKQELENQANSIKFDDKLSNTYVKINETQTSISNLQKSFDQITTTINDLQNSQSILNNEVNEINTSQFNLKQSFDEISNIETQIDPQFVEEVKIPIENLQNSIEEITNSIFELQAAQSISNVTINEMKELQTNLQHAVAELQITTIDLNNTILDVSTSQAKIEETITKWQALDEIKNEFADLVQKDLHPIATEVEKYGNRINLLKNYIDRLNDNLERAFEEIDTMKGHTIKNSTLLTPLKHIVPKVIQIEADMNSIKKQLESSSFHLTQELLKKVNVMNP